MYLSIVSIDNDNQAEELLLEISEAQEEKGRLIDICNAQIDKYMQKIEQYKMELANETHDGIIMLSEYCRKNANHKTQTLASYKLPSGKLQWKSYDKKVVVDDDKLLAWIYKNASDYVLIKSKPNWEILKNSLKAVGDHYEYVNPDGEIIPVDGVTLVEQPDTFDIK